MKNKQAILCLLPTLLLALGVLYLAWGKNNSRSLRDDGALAEELDGYSRIRHLLLENCLQDLDSRELLFDAVKGITSDIPYSSFYTPREAPGFQTEISGKLVGLGLLVKRKEGRVLVHRRLLGSPAAASLQAGMEILRIDGKSVQNLSLIEVTALLRGDGEVGSICRLVIRDAPDQNERTIELKRIEIKSPSVTTGEMLDPEHGIGYIRISTFQSHTNNEFHNAFQALHAEKLQTLIIDLRFNSGGVLDSAMKVGYRFYSDLLLTTQGKDPASKETYRAHPNLYINKDLELVFLINEDTASAAEALAGSLQDVGRARVVGNRSYGKGVVQSCIRVDLFGEPAVLKVPIALFFLPSGRTIEKKIPWEGRLGEGIQPDLTVSMSKSAKQALQAQFNEMLHDFIPEEQKPEPAPDPQLEAALGLLREK